jgi:hypothetical protein
MIDGLKLTMTGEELRRVLGERADTHRRYADHWEAERSRPAESQTEENPLLPEHMCEFEAERHEWRAEVLEFIRDHVELVEVYRLGASDLEFGELLPGKPGGVAQQEFEERTAVGFNLGRISKKLDRWPWITEERVSEATTR